MLKPDHLPGCLWDPDRQLLCLPPVLAEAFEAAVDARSLRDLLNDVNSDGPIGGCSEDETLEHFVNRFDGSSARLQLAFLDPYDHLETTSNIILSRLSGGTTCFVDAPCGTGAGFLSLLLTVARLRELGVLPCMRLDVKLIAADVSASAREIAAALLEEVNDVLEEQGIFVRAEWPAWDVTSESSTVDLNRLAIRMSDGCKSNFLLVANFSGYLIGEKKLKEAEPQLYELFKYFSGNDSFSVWIEPKTKDASGKGGLLDRLFGLASSKWSWFAKVSDGLSEAISAFKSEANFQSILRGRIAKARVCVSHMRLAAND
jgi:hypothetical protein